MRHPVWGLGYSAHDIYMYVHNDHIVSSMSWLLSVSAISAETVKAGRVKVTYHTCCLADDSCKLMQAKIPL